MSNYRTVKSAEQQRNGHISLAENPVSTKPFVLPEFRTVLMGGPKPLMNPRRTSTYRTKFTNPSKGHRRKFTTKRNN
jgi:hypothetical protein